MLVLLLVGCHHDDDPPTVALPDAPVEGSEMPTEEAPFSFAHNACNTSAFFSH